MQHIDNRLMAPYSPAENGPLKAENIHQKIAAATELMTAISQELARLHQRLDRMEKNLEDVASPIFLAVAWLQRGRQAKFQRNYAEAERCYTRAVRHGMQDAFAGIGTMALLQDKRSEASCIYREFLKQSSSPEALVGMGMISQFEGYLDDALDYYRDALGSEAQTLDGMLALGHIARLQGRFGEARAYYHQLTLLQPSHLNAISCMADIHLANQEFTQAEDAYHYALKIDSHYIKAFIGLGDLMMKKNDFHSALAYYTKASLADSQNPFALVRLGDAARLQSKGAEALDYYAKAKLLLESRQSHLLELTREALGNELIEIAVRNACEWMDSTFCIADVSGFQVNLFTSDRKMQ